MPCLQRYFVDPKEAKLMRWHAERKEAVLNDLERTENPVLTHPSDASQWKSLDDEFEEFGKEARNIRLGASTDGLNPFAGNQSSKHSMWPVFVWIYNLPLALHEEKVHTHEYANSRADTAGERYQPVSRAIKGRARNVVGG